MSAHFNTSKNISFNFSKRVIQVDGYERKNLLTYAVGDKNILFLLYKDFSLVKVDLQSGKTEKIISFDPKALTSTSNFNIYVSKNNEFLAITWTRVCVGADVSRGVVVSADDGRVQMHLDNGYYHTDVATFPVCFAVYNRKTVIVHATSWNRLDVTDVESQKLLTQRDFANIPKVSKEYKYGLTEWPGMMQASPASDKIAVQGWLWHPIGTFYSFSLKNWLERNPWESDRIPERYIYSQMQGWDNPFCWIDDTKVCIADNGFDSEAPFSTSIFDTETGDCVLKFVGPVPELFFFDKFLFSSLKKNEVSVDGLTIWSVDDGRLLYQQENFAGINDYNPAAKEFISLGEKGQIELIKWSYIYNS